MSVTVLALLVALIALVGLCGIIVPVLPGSLLVGLAALVWAIWGHSHYGWIGFALCAVLVTIGMASSALLTKRRLDQRHIPGRPITVGLVCALLGGFMVPALGVPLGFVVGLFTAEVIRVRDGRQAVSTSIAAVKAIGTGMIIELGCALAATAVLGSVVAVHMI